MEKFKLCGSTSRTAEIIIDYKKGTSEIVDVPDDTTKNRVISSLKDWVGNTMWLISIAFLILLYICENYQLPRKYLGVLVLTLTSSYLLVIGILSLISINKKWDMDFKKKIVYKTSEGKKNSCLLSDIKSKEFVLYNVKNVYLEFDASGDIGNQLNKIWIRNDPIEQDIKDQARVEYFNSRHTIPPLYKIWNAHFYFDEIPKDGTLYLRWI